MGFDAVCCALRRGNGHRSRNDNKGSGIHFVALSWAESAKLGTRDERNSGYFHFVADGKRQPAEGEFGAVGLDYAPAPSGASIGQAVMATFQRSTPPTSP